MGGHVVNIIHYVYVVHLAESPALTQADPLNGAPSACPPTGLSGASESRPRSSLAPASHAWVCRF